MADRRGPARRRQLASPQATTWARAAQGGEGGVLRPPAARAASSAACACCMAKRPLVAGTDASCSSSRASTAAEICRSRRWTSGTSRTDQAAEREGAHGRCACDRRPAASLRAHGGFVKGGEHRETPGGTETALSQRACANGWGRRHQSGGPSGGTANVGLFTSARRRRKSGVMGGTSDCAAGIPSPLGSSTASFGIPPWGSGMRATPAATPAPTRPAGSFSFAAWKCVSDASALGRREAARGVFWHAHHVVCRAAQCFVGKPKRKMRLYVMSRRERISAAHNHRGPSGARPSLNVPGAGSGAARRRRDRALGRGRRLLGCAASSPSSDRGGRAPWCSRSVGPETSRIASQPRPRAMPTLRAQCAIATTL